MSDEDYGDGCTCGTCAAIRADRQRRHVVAAITDYLNSTAVIDTGELAEAVLATLSANPAS